VSPAERPTGGAAPGGTSSPAGAALAGMLPDGAVRVEHEPTRGFELLREEWEVVRAAAPGRRAEFAAGRTCARDALRGLGVDGWALLPGPSRAPRWPPGIVGSITHAPGFVAAAVVRRDARPGLGIDAERHVELPDDVARLVCSPAERRWCRAEARARPARWATVVFSAKESVFKAWSSTTGGWLDPLDADLAVTSGPGRSGHFEVVALRGEGSGTDPSAFEGRYAICAGLVLTVASRRRDPGR
jgi:4'-phosphopantetheinyl transferase EntD